MKHVILVTRNTGATAIGPFDTYQKAEKYRDNLVTIRRAEEDDPKEYPIKGAMAFFITPIDAAKPEVLAPPKPRVCKWVGACEYREV